MVNHAGITHPFPLTHTITRRQFGEETTISGDFDDVVERTMTEDQIKVFGWSTPTEEIDGGKLSTLTIKYDLELFAPTGAFSIGDQAVIEATTYRVDRVGNWDNGPTGWLIPGLDQLHLTVVKG